MTSARNSKILIVDDDPQTLAALERLFKKSFGVKSFSNPRSAITYLESISESSDYPAVILSDFNLPEISGLDFLRKCQNLSKHSIRVILSGHIDLSFLFSAVTDGEIHRVLVKPWENEVLMLQMQEYLVQHDLLIEKSTLEHLATTDQVTKVFNRRYFEDHLNIEINRAARHNRVLSLLMVDADHFKDFNDQFGHQAGDQLLFQIAQHFVDCLRNIDIVSRYGGDEFALILPDTDKAAATDVAERIRISFNKKFSHLTTKVTICIGVATFPDDGSESGLLIEKADHALFQAKKTGRDKVIIA